MQQILTTVSLTTVGASQRLGF